MSSVAEAAISYPGRQRFPLLRALLADPFTCIALVLVVGFLITAAFAPWLAPYSPTKIDVLHKLQPPSAEHWFGTDHLGRDLLSRVIYGARTALMIAMVSVAIAGAVGLLLGLIAGYGPRWLDAMLVLTFDSLNSLPMIMFALAIITVLGAGTGTLILVIAATSFPSYARLIRAQTLALKNSDYILAERLLDASPARIIFVHLLPNVVGPLIILLSMDIPVVIMVEAGLSLPRPRRAAADAVLGLDPLRRLHLDPLRAVHGDLRRPAAGARHARLHLPRRGPARLSRSAPESEAAGMTGSLAARDLSVRYETPQGSVHALRHVDIEASPGEVIGIVGESGCGKSTLVTALANLLPANARVEGSIVYNGIDLVSLDAHRQRMLRGDEIALVSQDPMTAFNPVLTIGDQLVDFQHHRRDLSRAQKKARIADMLGRVGISDAERRMASYPHELSGGMRQRVAIAAALLTDPGLLIADEPTTALDVTMEAQIIHLLRELRREFNGIIIVVSHHLGVIAELCDRVYVMYAGEVVEDGDVDAIFHDARHPYTQALLACDPARFHDRLDRLPTIPGTLPSLIAPPAGCVYAPAATAPSRRAGTTAPASVPLSAGPWRPMPRGARMNPLLAVEDLSVTFARGGLISRLAQSRAAAGLQHHRRRHACADAGRDAGAGRRIRVRQDDAGAHHPRAGAGGGGTDRVRGQGCAHAGRFPRHAPPLGDDVPGSRSLRSARACASARCSPSRWSSRAWRCRTAAPSPRRCSRRSACRHPSSTAFRMSCPAGRRAASASPARLR